MRQRSHLVRGLRCAGKVRFFSFLFAVIFFASGVQAQSGMGLPPAPAAIGSIHRDAAGNIVPLESPVSDQAPAVIGQPPPVPTEKKRVPAAAPAPRPARPERAKLALSDSKVVDIPQPKAAGEITGLRIVNRGDEDQPATIITFGQVFVKGDVPKGQSLKAMSERRPLPLQLDVKTRYADDSIRYAILSMAIPALAEGRSVDVMLTRGDGETKGPMVELRPEAIPAFLIDVTFRDGADTGKRVRVSVRDLVGDSPGAAVGTFWLHGALESERRYRKAIGEGLYAQFDVRLDRNGQSRIDVTLTYDGAYSVPMRNIRYEFSAYEGDRQLLHFPEINHNHHANWHRVFVSGPQPSTQVVYDKTYWIRSRAVPAFDPSVAISQRQIGDDYARLRQSNTGPMGPALNVTYMPSTGQTDGEGVGLITNWQAKYLLSQDFRAEQVMLANADAAGSIPWHFRDEATGLPITIDRHPGVRISENGPGVGRDALPQVYTSKDTGWTPDTSHVPAFAYLPYLVTGSRYYLDEIQFQAAWTLAFYNPDFRKGAAGLIGTQKEEQVRGLAWSLRSLGDAAVATPDGEPLKAYFTEKLDNNLDRLVRRYVTDRALRDAGAVEGWMEGDNRDQTEVAPWQQDFFAMTLGYLGQRGFPQAEQMLLWMGNFLTGRFLNEKAGFDPRYGCAYQLRVIDPHTNRPFTNWGQVFNATFDLAKKPGDSEKGYPDDAGGYVAAARGALASLINAGGGDRARAAYGIVTDRIITPRLVAGYSQLPKWDIIPE